MIQTMFHGPANPLPQLASVVARLPARKSLRVVSMSDSACDRPPPGRDSRPVLSEAMFAGQPSR